MDKQTNPMIAVDPPTVEKKEADFYTNEDVKAILKKALDEDAKYYLLISLAITTGLRKGELMGLEWVHVDFENGTISVKQTSQYIRGKGTTTGTPKSKASLRTISIPKEIVDLLQRFKQCQDQIKEELGDKWEDHNRIFTQWNGLPMNPTTGSAWFRKFLVKNQLPNRSFHSLRHTHATLLIANGVDTKTIQARMGHEDAETTLNIYAHVLKKSDYEAADKIRQLVYN